MKVIVLGDSGGACGGGDSVVGGRGEMSAVDELLLVFMVVKVMRFG